MALGGIQRKSRATVDMASQYSINIAISIDEIDVELHNLGEVSGVEPMQFQRMTQF